MPKWMPCNGSFVVGDIIRWREPVWGRRARRGKKSRPIGERLIVAQITAVEDEWVRLALESSEAKLADDWWKPILPLKAGKPLVRRKAVLAKRNPERRSWGGKDGEPARALASSRFLR